MNPMDGKEGLLKIKAIKHQISTPVIIYSGTSHDEESKKIYKKFGAFEVIEKLTEVSEIFSSPG